MSLVQTESKRKLAERKANGLVINPASKVFVPHKPEAKIQRTTMANFKAWMESWVNTITGDPSKPLLLTQSVNAVARRLATYWINLPFLAYSCVRVKLSKKDSPERIECKNELCMKCDKRYEFFWLNGDVTNHCGPCGCKPRRWSTVERKNERSKDHCPLFRHGDNSPQLKALRAAGHDVGIAAGGCTGCGCGKK